MLLQLQFSKLGRILVTWRLNVTTANLERREVWGGHVPHHSSRAGLRELLSSTSANNTPCKTCHHHLLALRNLCASLWILQPLMHSVEYGSNVFCLDSSEFSTYLALFAMLLWLLFHQSTLKLLFWLPPFSHIDCAKFILALCPQDVLLAKGTLYKWVSVVPFSWSEFSLIPWTEICGSVDSVSVISVFL